MCPPGTIDPGQQMSHQGTGTSGGALAVAVGAFFNTIQSLPSTLRAVVIVAIAGIAGFVAYERYVAVPSEHIANAAPAAYTGGIPDPTHAGADSNNPQNIEADHKKSEDDAAVQWHLISHQSDDNPPETAIDANRQLSYRYFSKTDHCIFVRRRVGDHDATQWVRDPDYHLHDSAHGKPSAASGVAGGRTTGTTSGISTMQSLGGLLAVVAAASEPAAAAMGVGQACPNPINPHPGQFRFWWGTPVDQCNSPMYRQFVDGCTHYQFYNRCANSWDSRIFWTSCAAQHRW